MWPMCVWFQPFSGCKQPGASCWSMPNVTKTLKTIRFDTWIHIFIGWIPCVKLVWFAFVVEICRGCLARTLNSVGYVWNMSLGISVYPSCKGWHGHRVTKHSPLVELDDANRLNSWSAPGYIRLAVFFLGDGDTWRVIPLSEQLVTLVNPVNG